MVLSYNSGIDGDASINFSHLSVAQAEGSVRLGVWFRALPRIQKEMRCFLTLAAIVALSLSEPVSPHQSAVESLLLQKHIAEEDAKKISEVQKAVCSGRLDGYT